METSKDYWKEVSQYGTRPPKIKAHSCEYHDGFIYLFGGQDSSKANHNALYRFNIATSYWERLYPKGKPPKERCYHEIGLINSDNILIFGGIRGTLISIEAYYDDTFLYNISNTRH